MPSILLVPGTQATELVDGDGKVAYSASGLTILSKLGPLRAARIGQHTPEEWGELLGLEYDEGALHPRPGSVKLAIGKVLRTPYEPLYLEYGGDFADFPYDWRLDIMANGSILLDRLRVRSDAADGRWRVVGHSQGGLVIVAAAALAGPARFAGLVSHAALVGAPLAGTLRAAEALLWGRDDFGSDDALVSMLRGAARSWPALYQMLPAWPAIVDRDGAPAPAQLQLADPRGWPADHPLEHGNVQHLARTELFHEKALEWLADPGRVRLKVIMGLEQKTPRAIRRDGKLADGLEGQPTEVGDSLVPAAETLRWAGGLLNEPVELVQPNLAHAMLLKDMEVRDMLKSFFRSPAP